MEKLRDKEEALRFNDSKIRYDLLEPYAIEQLAKVFSKGAEKYAPYNWMKGMAWSKMLASLKRHIAAFEKGEDFDYDPNCKECIEGICKSHTGLHHMAHAMWNCAGLVSYSKYYPELDDRLHIYLKPKRYGLDIDDILADFVPAYCAKYNVPIPTSWQFDKDLLERFKTMEEDGSIVDFYMNLRPKLKSEDIPFEPVVYITSRFVDSSITEKWLELHGFPLAPVITTRDKVSAAKEHNIDIFVDDSWNNFMSLNREGIFCYLFDMPHNQRYNVGSKRIKSLKELTIC